MQYIVYFAVATPLLLGWLFLASAAVGPQPAAAMFHSFENSLHQAAGGKDEASAERDRHPETIGSAMPNYRAATGAPRRKHPAPSHPANSSTLSGSR
jgi:hypothetical protein